jgi:hypothetical protein
MKLIKSNKTISPFAGISFVNEEFSKSGLSALIDKELYQIHLKLHIK